MGKRVATFTKHFVVIHNDAGSIGATAEWYVNWLANRNKALGIAHYYIDRHTIARVIDTYKIAYHCGDGVSPTSGNGNYIGYEVCQSMGASVADFLANEDMTLRQVAEDMLFYKLPVDRNTVRLHREFVPTSCPHKSMELHGNKIDTVKDYFIGKIKHYQSLGKTVDEMIANENKPKVEAKPTATLTVRNINQDKLTYDAVLTNIKAPNGVREVLLPTWTSANGQDDLVWHKATKQPNGEYVYTVKASEHKNEQGIYVTHAYIVSNSGTKFGVGAYDLYLNKQKPTGKIEITKNIQAGTFTIKVTGVTNPNGVKEVKLPTWTEEGNQDDLKWYVADKQPDGSYTKTVNIKDHKNGIGRYIVHGYVVQKNDQLNAFAGTDFVFNDGYVPKYHTTVTKGLDEVTVYTLPSTKIKHVTVTEAELDKFKK